MRRTTIRQEGCGLWLVSAVGLGLLCWTVLYVVVRVLLWALW